MNGATEPTTSWPLCCVCHRELRTDEHTRQACRPCTSRVDRDLSAIPGPTGYYAQLANHLAPGAGASDSPRITVTRVDPALPVRLGTLNLLARGGVVTILQSWLIDWHETLGWTHPRWEGDLRGQCDQVVQRLRANLEWAASEHPAFDEFAREVREVVAACRRHITGEQPERRIAVTCADPCCGRTLHVTVSTIGLFCPCGMKFSREEALSLPLATRTQAAA